MTGKRFKIAVIHGTDREGSCPRRVLDVIADQSGGEFSQHKMVFKLGVLQAQPVEFLA